MNAASSAQTPVPLKVAVVGHTNTGKTSLLRTLMRDVSFGEVSDRPATTRHVEGATLLVNGQPLIELYDTPGLEDSMSLLDHLDSMRSDRRVSGYELVNQFLASPEARGRFSQEAKALRQLLASDVALYVIDARDQVHGKHRDELEILARCARPVVPVLNFVASPDAKTAAWREHLSRVNMHAVAKFDTVVFDEDSERRLLEKMATLLDQHRATLEALIDERKHQRRALVQASAAIVADMLIDVAAYEVSVPTADAEQTRRAIEALKQRVRDREQQCVEQLLELHRFRPDDYQAEGLPIVEGRWGIDLFSSAAMNQFGIRAGGGAAAGALAGLTIDAMVGGISLGAATAVGAAIGALLGAGQAHGKRVIDRLRGRSELRCDDATLRLLMARQATLIQALLRRGHASLRPIQLGVSATEQGAIAPVKVPRRLPEALDEAKLRPQWSRLTEPAHPGAIASTRRRAVQDRLAESIESLLLSQQPASTHAAS